MDIYINFWDWFLNNSDEIFEFERNKKVIFKNISQRLAIINKDLTFLFSPTVEGKRRFIISANGIKSAFKFVYKLVDSAPYLPKWEVVALKPRIGISKPIKMGDFILYPENVFFTHEKFIDYVDLDFYIKSYDKNNKKYHTALFCLLDNALGEYNVATKIGSIKINRFDFRKVDFNEFKSLPIVMQDYLLKDSN